MMAGAVVTVAPVLILFLALQRYYIRGMLAGMGGDADGDHEGLLGELDQARIDRLMMEPLGVEG